MARKDQVGTDRLSADERGRIEKRRGELKKLGGIAIAGGAALAAASPLLGGVTRLTGISLGSSTSRPTTLIVPSVTSDPENAAPGTLYYRSDLGDLRIIDGVHQKPQSLSQKIPELVVGGDDPAQADFGSFTPGTTSDGLWEALGLLPTGSDGRRYGQIRLRPGVYDLREAPDGVRPFDLGNAIVEGSGANTFVRGSRADVTFARPSGHGRLVDVMFEGR
ncbi:MAG TPA: hypothetical protein VMH78_04465 [Thermoplasmata archaeon]|nr:hypothetical protein [Thermoplasmata archaeon]